MFLLKDKSFANLLDDISCALNLNSTFLFLGEEYHADLPLPFPQDSFQAIFILEVLETVLENPCRFFYEIATHIKNKGYLIIVSENAPVKFFDNLFDWKFGSPYHHHSFRFRNNRNFTVKEIESLTRSTGLTPVQSWIQDIIFVPSSVRLRRVQLAQFLCPTFKVSMSELMGSHIFFSAQKMGSVRFPIVEGFFETRGEVENNKVSVENVLKPYICMGENDHIQVGEGWYPLESPPLFRWSAQKANLHFRVDGEEWFYLKVFSHQKKDLEIRIGSKQEIFGLLGDEQVIWMPISPRNGIVTVELRTEAWIPMKQGINEDSRELGIGLKTAGFSYHKGDIKECVSFQEAFSFIEEKMISRNPMIPWGYCGSEVAVGEPSMGNFYFLGKIESWIWKKIEYSALLRSLILNYAAEHNLSFLDSQEKILNGIGFLLEKGMIYVKPI